MYAPKKYGAQFHPKYAKAEDLDKAVKGTLSSRSGTSLNAKMLMGSTIPSAVGLPGMTAFTRTADDPDHHTYERNPYYWKVDTAGNQLPYIDKVIINIIADKELLTTRLLSGELDFSGHSTYLKNVEALREADRQKDEDLSLGLHVDLGRADLPQPDGQGQGSREFFNQKERARRSLGGDQS